MSLQSTGRRPRRQGSDQSPRQSHALPLPLGKDGTRSKGPGHSLPHDDAPNRRGDDGFDPRIREVLRQGGGESVGDVRVLEQERADFPHELQYFITRDHPAPLSAPC